jgi:hypothetical protein
MTITNKIITTIQKKGRGWVFTNKSFLKLRHRNTIDKLISRICANGVIRHIGNGLYDYPVFDNNTEKYLPPKLKFVIKALETQLNVKLQYSGEYACYLLGIKKEKPQEIVFFTSGNSLRFNILEEYEIILKKTSIPAPRNKEDKAILALQALIYLGKNNIYTEESLTTILKQLNTSEKKKFYSLKKYMPAWLNNILK